MSAVVLVALLAQTRMFLADEFISFTFLGFALLALTAFCHYRGHDWRLKDSAAITAIGIASLMLCGLVSNIGLRLGLPLADPLLARVDHLAGFNTRAVVGWTASQPLMATAFHFVYSSSGALCVAAIGWRLFQGNRSALWSLVATAVGAMQLTALLSIMFPARGAILHFGLDVLQGHGLPLGAGSYSATQFANFYFGSDPLVTLSKMHGIVTFPSFHTVMALLILQGFWDTPWRNFAVGWCALTIVSTVPMGGHYVVDLAGGILVWSSTYGLVRRISPE